MTLCILIVDDNAADRYLLRRRLGKIELDLAVLEAENGKRAMDEFTLYKAKRDAEPDAHPPLLIFLDINMPIVDGFGFLSAFHHIGMRPEFEPPTVVMLTSSHRSEDKERSLKWDFVKDYIVKGELTEASLTALLAEHHRHAAEIRAQS